MTAAQLKFHWVLFGFVLETTEEERGRRLNEDERRELRRRLYRKALGHDLSIKDWREVTRWEFDKIKGVFLAHAAPSDLLAQMEIEEQPAIRKRLVEARAVPLFAEIGGVVHPGKTFAQAITAYIVLRIFGRSATWEKLTDLEAACICGILFRRKRQLERKAAVAADDGVVLPF